VDDDDDDDDRVVDCYYFGFVAAVEFVLQSPHRHWMVNIRDGVDVPVLRAVDTIGCRP
jgi:hypothetical protein